MAHYPYHFSVHRLRVPSHLGFYDAERAVPQPIEISLRLHFAAPPACMGDDFANFVDYAGLSEKLVEAVQQREFRLIEFMAQELFALARSYADAHGAADARLWLSLHKCQPEVPHLQNGASFTLTDLGAGDTIAPLV